MMFLAFSVFEKRFDPEKCRAVCVQFQRQEEKIYVVSWYILYIYIPSFKGRRVESPSSPDPRAQRRSRAYPIHMPIRSEQSWKM